MDHSHPHIRVAAILIKANQVLLHRRSNADQDYWIFPSGSITGNEPPSQAIRREVAKQTGLEIVEVYEEKDHFDEEEKIQYHYLVAEVGDGLIDDQYKWFNITDAIRLDKLYPAQLKIHLKFLNEKQHENKKKLH